MALSNVWGINLCSTFFSVVWCSYQWFPILSAASCWFDLLQWKGQFVLMVCLWFFPNMSLLRAMVDCHSLVTYPRRLRLCMRYASWRLLFDFKTPFSLQAKKSLSILADMWVVNNWISLMQAVRISICSSVNSDWNGFIPLPTMTGFFFCSHGSSFIKTEERDRSVCTSVNSIRSISAMRYFAYRSYRIASTRYENIGRASLYKVCVSMYFAYSNEDTENEVYFCFCSLVSDSKKVLSHKKLSSV